jgi:hypothetical protein
MQSLTVGLAAIWDERGLERERRNGNARAGRLLGWLGGWAVAQDGPTARAVRCARESRSFCKHVPGDASPPLLRRGGPARARVFVWRGFVRQRVPKRAHAAGLQMQYRACCEGMRCKGCGLTGLCGRSSSGEESWKLQSRQQGGRAIKSAAPSEARHSNWRTTARLGRGGVSTRRCWTKPPRNCTRPGRPTGQGQIGTR